MVDDIGNVSEVFVGIVNALMAKNVHGKDIYVITNEGRYMNFKASDFKRASLVLIHKDLYKQSMNIFRNLEWIICKDGRFTNVQFINGKPIRVITVDLIKYKQLKELLPEGRNKEDIKR